MKKNQRPKTEANGATGPSQSLPVNYVLYTHYRNDVKFLEDRLPYLERLLESPAHEGLLVIFVADGLYEMLNELAEGAGKEKTDSGQELPERVKQTDEFRDQIVEACARHSPDLKERIRVITPSDFREIFRTAAIEKLNFFLKGDGERLAYDAPKIPEAFVRLRLLGTGIPVFRLDEDVLFPSDEELGISHQMDTSPPKSEDRSDKQGFDLFRPVVTAVKAYRQRVRDPNVATFLFSGCYEQDSVRDRGKGFYEWGQAFATRLFPALHAKPESYPTGNWKDPIWKPYVDDKDNFDEEVAAKFLGIEYSEDDKNYRQLPDSGISRFGAPSLTSVISGALLSISDGAILSLPPFSNFSQNVMWIDDHLKYRLHWELGHLVQRIPMHIDEKLRASMIGGIVVRKRRDPVKNLPFYTCCIYLPSLVLGIIMDAWITRNRVVKFQRKDLNDEDRKESIRISNELKEGKMNSPFGEYLRDALLAGTFSEDKRTLLKGELEESAKKTLSELREHWMKLKAKDGGHTFASAWATGPGAVQEILGEGWDEHCEKCRSDPGFPLAMVKDGNGAESGEVWDKRLDDMVSLLVDETCEYINWALAWPRITQIIRTVPQGRLRFDLDWSSSGPEDS